MNAVNNLITLLTGVLSQQNNVPADLSNGADEVAGAGGGLLFGGTMDFILIYGAMFAVLWFLMIRPQRKKQKQQREMLAQLTVGENIVTNSGMFGKIVDIGEDSYIVEFGTNKGIRIPILKSEVVGIREPKLTPPPKED